MKVLVVNHFPVFAGPHNHFMRLAPGLAGRGWDTVFVLPEEPGNAAARLREAGVTVIQMPLHRLRARKDPRLHAQTALGFAPEVRRLRSLIASEGADLVVAPSLENPHGALAAHLQGTAVVWQLIGTMTPMALRRAMMPVVSRMADVVMSTGRIVADQHPGSRALGERLVPFFTPVDVDEFSPSAERRRRARAELGIPDDAVVIGNVSNVNPQKGHGTFIDAAARLRASHPQVRFVILGATHDSHPEYMPSLLAQADRLGLRRDEDLLWRDPGSRVSALAPAIDVFWMTSNPNSEGVPTVVLEAMAMGLPVITTEAGGVRDAVRDGIDGFVVRPHRPQAIAEVTERLLADAELRSEIGRRARQTAVERFRSEVCLETHVKAFSLALEHRRARRRGPAAADTGAAGAAAGESPAPAASDEAAGGAGNCKVGFRQDLPAGRR